MLNRPLALYLLQLTKKEHMKRDCLPGKLFFLLLLLLMQSVAFSQKKAVGIFDGHIDVGVAVKPGAATYISQTGQYVVSGAGYNIWGDHDEFQFLWKKMKGDFTLSARADFVGWNGVEQHRKVGWMVRQTLDGKSPQVNAVVHGDGLTSLQYRKTTGAQTLETRSKLTHATWIQLERKGTTYTMKVSADGKEFVTEQVTEIDLGNDVYVGVFVGSHNKDVVETGVFSNVKISKNQ
jgi:TolB protein